MAAVPQKTLNWLYGVLGREYRDQNRAYNDVAQTLSQYPSLAPKTDVYTYEHGAPALLLQLSGTIPVAFRTETYRFPITIWVPHAYPLEAPIIYVTPTEDMRVRPGQHVGGEGRVYHHFLAHWREAWDRATIVELLRVLSAVFAKEPPVMAKQQYMPRPPPQPPSHPSESVQSPRPPPQIPSESNRTPSGQNIYSSAVGPTPPPPPPKQREGENTSSEESRPKSRYSGPPPLPPEARESSRSQQVNGSNQRFSGSQNYLPRRQSSLSHSMLAQGASPQPTPPQNQQQWNQQRPPPGQMQQQPPISYQQHPNQPGQPPAAQYTQITAQQYATQQLQPHRSPANHQGQPYLPSSQQQSQLPFTPQPHPQQPAKLQPQPSLLDSPFEITLPSATSLPAPPVPRNPEKDALLSTLSATLTSTLHTSINQNTSAFPSLSAQHAALSSTYSQLQSELQSLTTLTATLSSNNAILTSSLQSSDRAIASARERAAKGDIPKVDEMVTAPTIVERQLYDLVCEERGIEAAIWALQEGFVRGRIGSEVWSKQTRNLAREGFRKRYLAKKVARGMGLDLT